MLEISDKISLNDGMYTTCMTSVTTFSQKREYMQNFSQGKKSKFINFPSSLDVFMMFSMESFALNLLCIEIMKLNGASL